MIKTDNFRPSRTLKSRGTLAVPRLIQSLLQFSVTGYLSFHAFFLQQRPVFIQFGFRTADHRVAADAGKHIRTDAVSRQQLC